MSALLGRLLCLAELHDWRHVKPHIWLACVCDYDECRRPGCEARR